MLIHTVQRNETLYSIASLYSLSPSYIQNINLLPNPNQLVVGQNILILFPERMHTIKEGETLYSISQAYNVPIITLLRNNPFLSVIPHLNIGDEIVIEFQHQIRRSIITNGYTYGMLPEEVLRLALPYFTFISPFTYGIEKDGSLIRPQVENTLFAASSYPAKPLMHISTITYYGNFSIEPVTYILNTPSIWETVLNHILSEISFYGYVGIDIDFEYINPEDSLKYAAFVSYLKENLNPYGYIVITALAPKTSSDQKGVLYEGHNYRALGEASNFVFIMTYEWGYTYGPPMAVAPIPSVRRVLDYAITEIDPNKILMGIPSYGYDWTLPYAKGGPAARSISVDEAVMLALRYQAEIRFDDFSQSPYFYYTDEAGNVHEVWFEDAKSVLEKLRLVEEYKFAGCGYWNLERPFVQSYMIINNLYRIAEFPFAF